MNSRKPEDSGNIVADVTMLTTTATTKNMMPYVMYQDANREKLDIPIMRTPSRICAQKKLR